MDGSNAKIKTIPVRKKNGFKAKEFVWRDLPPEVLHRASGLFEYAIIYITMTTRRSRASGRPSHKCALTISHKNKQIMEWLIEWFGGSYSNSIGHYAYKWECICINAAIVLKELSPYLVSKKAHANIVILYASTIVPAGRRGGRGNRGRRLTDEEIAYRIELQEELRRLNKEIIIEDVKQQCISERVMKLSRGLGLFDFEGDGLNLKIDYKDKGFFDSFITHLTKRKG